MSGDITTPREAEFRDRIEALLAEFADVACNPDPNDRPDHEPQLVLESWVIVSHWRDLADPDPYIMDGYTPYTRGRATSHATAVGLLYTALQGYTR